MILEDIDNLILDINDLNILEEQMKAGPGANKQQLMKKQPGKFKAFAKGVGGTAKDVVKATAKTAAFAGIAGYALPAMGVSIPLLSAVKAVGADGALSSGKQLWDAAKAGNVGGLKNLVSGGLGTGKSSLSWGARAAMGAGVAGTSRFLKSKTGKSAKDKFMKNTAVGRKIGSEISTMKKDLGMNKPKPPMNTKSGNTFQKAPPPKPPQPNTFQKNKVR